MRCFARIAYEGEVFDADGGEAVFGLSAAVGTDGVGGETGEVFYGCFGGGWHGFGCLCFCWGLVLCRLVQADVMVVVVGRAG